MKRYSAFSLIELSIVILIIGILIAGVLASSRLVAEMRLSVARQLTQSSPVASISDLVLWLEPTMENTFSNSTGGNYTLYTNVIQPNDGDAIGLWNDYGMQRTKNPAYQTNAGFRPKYSDQAINNLPALKFTATDFSYMLNPLNINNLPDMTAFVVFSELSQPTKNCLLGNDNGGWDRFLCTRLDTNSNNGSASNGTGFVTVSNLNSVTTGIATIVMRSKVSSGSKVYVNGIDSATYTENFTAWGDANLWIGAIGSANSSKEFDGYIAEIIIFQRALKNEERIDIEKYLSKKWGIKIS